jgi:hypothetical protein
MNYEFTLPDMLIVLVILGFLFFFMNRTPEQFTELFYDPKKDPRQYTNKTIFDYVFTSPKSVY